MKSRSVVQESVIPLATLLLLSLAVAAPLWGPGLLNTRGGGDSPFNLLRVHELAANLRAGCVPARWMAHAAYGLGYPFFHYYAALPYYLAAAFTLIGLDILSAIKLTQTLFFAAAALGMYGWARRALHSRAAGWLAAVAYTVTPYHLVNVYVRGDSLSEFAAFAFYPLILWGLDRLIERPSLRRAIPPGLAYAGLIVTHNLSAFIFSPFILLYIGPHVLRALRAPSRASRATLKMALRPLALAAVSLVIGILLSAWYWLPIPFETDAVQLTAQTSGYFAYQNHFRGGDLIQPRLIFDYAAITPERPTAFAAMGLTQALLTAAGIVAALVGVRRRIKQSSQRAIAFRLAFGLTGLLIATWLITPLSRPVWALLTPLQMAQFPWRFLSVQALFAALLTGFLVVRARRWRWPVAAALALILVVAGIAGLRPEYLPITAQAVTTERLQLYELFTGNIGTTIRYEWLPRWVVPRPYTGPSLFDPATPPQPTPLDGELTGTQEVAHHPTRRVWHVETGSSGAKIAFPLYYWPGWRARVDGTPVQVRPTPDSGTISLTLPPGEHRVTLWLGHTPPRLIGELTTLATALALAALGVGWMGRKRGANGPGLEIYRPRLLCCLAFAAGLGLLIAFQPRLGDQSTALTMDFDRMPYLHQNPAGVDFDGWRLVDYEYSAEQLAPGDTLRVVIEGAVESEATNPTLQLVSPAHVRRETLAPIAARDVPLAQGTAAAAVDIPIPQQAGPGLYLLHLADQTRSVYLRPLWISALETPALHTAQASFADGALRLHALEATQPAPDRLDLRLTWSAARPVAANYKISLRVTDPAGSEWARLDTQPGYGFLPTSLWPVGRTVHDRYTLQLPPGIPPGEAYTLTIILYRAASGGSVGQHVASIALDQATVRPDAAILAHLGDGLALSGLETAQRVRQGEALALRPYWLAVEQPAADYRVEWRLESAAHTISATLPLAAGSSPTTWPTGAWIAGRAALPIPPDMPLGPYTLSLTLRHPIRGEALASYTHPQAIQVAGQERVWTLPQMSQSVDARFGADTDGLIELAGYDLRREGNTVRLTLHWQALSTMDRHYAFFVHVADPVTGRPVTQIDSMPRSFTYPTGLWLPGEVVSDEVELSLEDVPAGEYDVAIGWYDPDDPSQRLWAVDGEGNRWPGDRLILADQLTVR